MQLLHNTSINRKLTLLVMVSVGVALSLAYAAFVFNDVRAIRKSMVQELTALADVLGSNSAASITFDDSAAAEQILSSLRKQPTVKLACVYDAEGSVFATYAADGAAPLFPTVPPEMGSDFTADGHLDVSDTIVVDGDLIGTIVLRASLDVVNKAIIRDAAITGLVTVLSFGAAYLLASWLQGGISGPILALANAAKQIAAAEDYSIRVQTTSRDELGILYDQFNRMLEHVETGKRDLQEAHRKLERQSQERMQAIVETAADGIITFTEDGLIESCNTASCDLSGYAREDLVGSHFANLLADLKGMPWRQYLAKHLETHTSRKQAANEIEARCKDGTVISLLISLSKIATDDGWLFTAILRDLTEFKNLQRELNQSQRLESIGQLAAGIAHEINTPMQFVGDNIEYLNECTDRLFQVVDAYQQNLIVGSVPKAWEARSRELDDIIKANKFDRLREQIPQAITESIDGIQRVKHIVRAMKEFSHPGGGERVPSDLNRAIESTVTITRNRWKYVANLELELDPDLPSVWCYPADMNQVLLNLIVNAGDAIADKVGDSGDALGRIVVRSRAVEGNAVIEVEDNGCGIPEEIRNRVFDPFFTTKEVGKGTGQGLAICYNAVVNKHGGSLSVESTPGVGSLFRITMPVARPTAAKPDERYVAAEQTV